MEYGFENPYPEVKGLRRNSPPVQMHSVLSSHNPSEQLLIFGLIIQACLFFNWIQYHFLSVNIICANSADITFLIKIKKPFGLDVMIITYASLIPQFCLKLCNSNVLRMYASRHDFTPTTKK